MPARTIRIPKLRLHKPSGQGVVTSRGEISISVVTGAKPASPSTSDSSPSARQRSLGLIRRPRTRARPT